MSLISEGVSVPEEPVQGLLQVRQKKNWSPDIFFQAFFVCVFEDESGW